MIVPIVRHAPPERVRGGLLFGRSGASPENVLFLFGLRLHFNLRNMLSVRCGFQSSGPDAITRAHRKTAWIIDDGSWEPNGAGPAESNKKIKNDFKNTLFKKKKNIKTKMSVGHGSGSLGADGIVYCIVIFILLLLSCRPDLGHLKCHDCCRLCCTLVGSDHRI